MVAAFLKSRGFCSLGVSSLEEALAILQVTSVDLFVLTPPLPAQLPLFLKHRLAPTICSFDLLEAVAKLAREHRQVITVHLKVDTGFGRLGLAPGQVLPLIEHLQNEPFLRLGTVFTHFSSAFNNPTFTKRQLQSFLDLKGQVLGSGGHERVLWHAANSAAFLTLPASHLDMVRIATLLYGQSPIAQGCPWDLATTWQFKTRIIHTRTLPKGHWVGYGRKYRTKKPTRIGVIPVGYSQGLELEPLTTPWRQIKRALGQGLKEQYFAFHPQGPLPILGRVGMGSTTLDLTTVPVAQVGDCVTISMRRVTASGHVPRIYYLDGKCKYIFWNHRLLRPDGQTITSRGLF